MVLFSFIRVPFFKFRQKSIFLIKMLHLTEKYLQIYHTFSKHFFFVLNSAKWQYLLGKRLIWRKIHFLLSAMFSIQFEILSAKRIAIFQDYIGQEDYFATFLRKEAKNIFNIFFVHKKEAKKYFSMLRKE